MSGGNRFFFLSSENICQKLLSFFVRLKTSREAVMNVAMRHLIYFWRGFIFVTNKLYDFDFSSSDFASPFDPNEFSNQSIKSFLIFPTEQTHETSTSNSSNELDRNLFRSLPSNKQNENKILSNLNSEEVRNNFQFASTGAQL